MSTTTGRAFAAAEDSSSASIGATIAQFCATANELGFWMCSAELTVEIHMINLAHLRHVPRTCRFADLRGSD
jgi:hypothetical protein